MTQVPRVAIFGDVGVGKTALITGNVQEPSTIGMSTHQVEVSVGERTARLRLVDLPGQETYRSIAPITVHNVNAIILVFDLTRPETFRNVSEWLKVRNDSVPDALIFLVGNKMDLIDDRQVSPDEARNWAIGCDCPYLETSAVSRQGVEDMLRTVATALPQSTESSSAVDLGGGSGTGVATPNCCG
jgi:small GTP-binding protein